jgi:hypothetical protein
LDDCDEEKGEGHDCCFDSDYDECPHDGRPEKPPTPPKYYNVLDKLNGLYKVYKLEE